MRALSARSLFPPCLLLLFVALLIFPTSASLQGAGQRCGPFGKCDSGLVCNPTNVRCEHQGGENETCRASDTPCDSGLTCVLAVCKRPPEPPQPGTSGGVCRSDGSCDSGLECVFGACLPRGGRAQPCRSDGSCDSGLACAAVVCVDAGDTGQPCRPDGGCNTGLECAAGVCAPSPPRGGAGQPCRAGSVCDGGLRCVANACVYAGGLAQPCRADGTCDANLACIADACAPAGGALQPCLSGNRCNGDLICEEGRICVLPPPVGGTWQPCRPDGTCNAGLQCQNFMCVQGQFELLELPRRISREAYMLRRAPGGRFDFEGYRAAAGLAARLPAPRLGSPRVAASGRRATVSSALTASNPMWEFVGPTNLEMPLPTSLGYGPVAGRVNAVAYSFSNPDVIFAGSGAGGLFRSDDGGKSWKPLSDGIDTAGGGAKPVWPDLHVSSIALSRRDPNLIFVGLGDFPDNTPFAGGIMRSTDGGQTWTNHGAADFGTSAVSNILVDPEDPHILIATTGRGAQREGKVWRSDDSGDTWAPIAAPDAQWSGAAIGSLPGMGGRAYYVAGSLPRATKGGPHAAVILRSRDRGVTWTTLTAPTSGDEDAFVLATSPKDPDTVYGLLPGDGSRRGSIWRSKNQGDTWTDITGGFPNDGAKGPDDNWSQGWYDFFIACTSRGGKDVLYVGLISVAVSPDGGATWGAPLGAPTLSSRPITHDDQHALVFHPDDPNTFLLANDGGVYRGKFDPMTQATSFDSLNRRLPITMFYHAAFHPTDPNVMLGGAQDNMTAVSGGDLNNWIEQGGGDGGGVAISQVRPNIQYTTTQGMTRPGPFGSTLPWFGFYRTDSGWFTAPSPLGQLPAPQQLIPPYTGDDKLAFTPAVTIDPQRSTVVYTGTQDLWRLDDEFPLRPFSWKKMSNSSLSTDKVIAAIAVAPGNRDTIYTAHVLDGGVWASFDRGENWKQLDVNKVAPLCVPQPGGSQACPQAANALSVNPDDPNDVLVGFGTNNAGTLYRCTATNTDTPVWANLSGAGGANPLPNISLNAIARDPDRPQTTFYVGTDFGVYMTDDAGANWFNAGWPLGLPPMVPVNDLVMVPKTRFLNAATYGRGMWRLALPEDRPAIDVFAVSPDAVTGGDSFNARLTLARTAPPTGVAVTFDSSNPAAVPAPTPTRIQGLQSELLLSLPTATVSADAPVTITARVGDMSKSVSVTVHTARRPELSGFAMDAPEVAHGRRVGGFVELDGPAPPGGIRVRLKSSSRLFVMPQEVLIREGQRRAEFIARARFFVFFRKRVTLSAWIGNMTPQTHVLKTPIIIKWS